MSLIKRIGLAMLGVAALVAAAGAGAQAERVTLFVREVVNPGGFRVHELYGTIASRQAGETVTIQARDCGSAFFRVVDGAETRDGGGWSTQYNPRISTTLRAVWNEAVSNQVSIRLRIRPSLRRDRLGRFLVVSVGGQRSFWHRRVVIQHRVRAKWKELTTVLLTETSSQGGVYAGSSASAKFRPSVRRGTLLRAAISAAQVKPCYLPGAGEPVRW